MKRYDKLNYLTNKMNKNKIEEDKNKESKIKKDKDSKKSEKKVKPTDSKSKRKKEDVLTSKESKVITTKSVVEVFPLKKKSQKINLWEKIKLFVKSFKGK